MTSTGPDRDPLLSSFVHLVIEPGSSRGWFARRVLNLYRKMFGEGLLFGDVDV